jgi:hypothetical protein
MRAVLTEHHAILSAFKKGDGSAAGIAVAKHLDSAAKRLKSMVEHFVGVAKVTPLHGPARAKKKIRSA